MRELSNACLGGDEEPIRRAPHSTS
jgi:hypothetical protein